MCPGELGPMSVWGSGIPECLGSIVEILVARVASRKAVSSEASGAGQRVYHTCHEVVATTIIKVAVAAEVWIDASFDASKAELKPQVAEHKATTIVAEEQ